MLLAEVEAIMPPVEVAVPTANVALLLVGVTSLIAKTLTRTVPVTLKRVTVPTFPGSLVLLPLKEITVPAGMPIPAIIDHISPVSIMSGVV